jgi:transcriptional regulator with XRE-family HTH domain
MLGTNQLLEALQERGVSQAEMARVLRLPSPRISEMYAGKRQIKLDEAKRLVDAFGLDDVQAAPPINEQTARLLVLHVANRLRLPLSPDDDRVQELALDFQAFSKFARAHLPAPSPDATSGFLEGRRSDRALSPAKP